MERALEIIRSQELKKVQGNLKKLLEKKTALQRRKLITRGRRRAALTALEAKIALAYKAVERLESSAYAERLASWKPWELGAGAGVHLGILEGFASSKFKQFISSLARSNGVSEREVWTGILESLRKAQWQATKHLIEEHGAKTFSLPITVIHWAPDAGAVLLKNELRRKKPSFDAAQAAQNAGFFLRREVKKLYELQGLLKTLKAPYTGSAATGNIVALDEDVVRNALNKYLEARNARGFETRELLRVTARETAARAHPKKREFEKKLGRIKQRHLDDLMHRVDVEDEYVREAEKSITQKLVENHADVFEPLIRRLKLERA